MRNTILAYASFSPLFEKVRTLTGLETTENPSLLEPGRRPLQIKDRAASWPHARGRRDSGVLRCVSHGAIGPRPVLLSPGAAGCVRASSQIHTDEIALSSELLTGSVLSVLSHT